MRAGWTDKEAAPVLGISSTAKCSQAMTPALTKIAKLWRVDPTRTLKDILDAVERLDPMTDAELDLRVRIATGRVDVWEVTPSRSSTEARRPCGPP